MKTLKGSLVALVTPFLEDGRVNYTVLEELLDYHLSHQTDGIVLLGTTGEATTLTIEEQEEMVRLAVKKLAGKIPLIVGAGSNDTSKAVALAKRFSALGADYLLTITPYYNKTNTSGLIQHFKAIANASSCPIILYNVPSRTGMSIPISVLKELKDHPNIIGIKEASGNMSYASAVACLLSDDFLMLSGNDDLIVPMMSIGSVGVISVLANVAPKATHEMCAFCLEENYRKAAEKQLALLPVIESLFYETNPIPVKEAMNYLGFAVGGYRLPLFQMDSALKEKMIQRLQENKEMLY